MPFENLVREGVYRFHLFTIKLFLLGGCRPPDPLLFLGGFQPPRPPGGEPAAPRAPCQKRRTTHPSPRAHPRARTPPPGSRPREDLHGRRTRTLLRGAAGRPLRSTRTGVQRGQRTTWQGQAEGPPTTTLRHPPRPDRHTSPASALAAPHSLL